MNYQEFRSLVSRMRAAQEAYFLYGGFDYREIAKKLEAQVDEVTQAAHRREKCEREYDQGQKNFVDETDDHWQEQMPF